MSQDFLYGLDEWLIALGFLAMLLLAGEGGFRLGNRVRSRVPETTKSQITNLQGAILALFGLLLAFTFSMAVSRYDLRKQLVVEESTSIGTTYLRAQLLPEPYSTEISRLLRDYVDMRLQFFAVGADLERVAQVSAETERIQDEIWSQAIVAAAIDPQAETTGWFLQSLNETIDLPTKRLAALQNRIPEVVILLLFFGGILAVGAVGYGYGLGAHRNIFLMSVFSVLIVLVVVVIIDLDRPRRGLITVSQQSMLELRESLDRSRPWDEQGSLDPDGGSWLHSGAREASSPMEPESPGPDDVRRSIIATPGETTPFRSQICAKGKSSVLLPYAAGTGSCSLACARSRPIGHRSATLRILFVKVAYSITVLGSAGPGTTKGAFGPCWIRESRARAWRGDKRSAAEESHDFKT